MEIAFALSILAVLALANGLATRLVIRDAYAEPRQRIFQVLAAWLVPVFGAIFVFALHRKPEKPSGGYSQSLDPPWDDFTTSRQVGRSINSHIDN